ncbi:hypothetical protein BC936DRAFT_143991 [Jimgerdemannia flammicorona]|uniref:Uncharacterized protein n=1 Tax=Jimgerdemannia flammicorona TaxID=994334 RepID=A0A432ZYP9_9FUNG|nr:hypothetical protein BC936DRAFT_143991 [Jimgerdemannia flammicorona]
MKRRSKLRSLHNSCLWNCQRYRRSKRCTIVPPLTPKKCSKRRWTI